jgi:hypothetical protein
LEETKEERQETARKFSTGRGAGAAETRAGSAVEEHRRLPPTLEILDVTEEE